MKYIRSEYNYIQSYRLFYCDMSVLKPQLSFGRSAIDCTISITPCSLKTNERQIRRDFRAVNQSARSQKGNPELHWRLNWQQP